MGDTRNCCGEEHSLTRHQLVGFGVAVADEGSELHLACQIKLWAVRSLGMPVTSSPARCVVGDRASPDTVCNASTQLRLFFSPWADLIRAGLILCGPWLRIGRHASALADYSSCQVAKLPT